MGKKFKLFQYGKLAGYKGDGKLGITIGNGALSFYLVKINIHIYYY